MLETGAATESSTFPPTSGSTSGLEGAGRFEFLLRSRLPRLEGWVAT